MEISNNPISIADISGVLSTNGKLSLGEDAKANILKCRNYLDEKMKEEGAKYYGVNTGFGSLCDVEISKTEINQLQENLVKSHACGMGKTVPLEIVRIMLILKIQSLAYGHSGIALKTVERLMDMFNANVIPVIYTQGSLGASGDLAPLAHLSLPILGKGEVWYNAEKINGESLEKRLGWEPIKLQSKEGLALLNGTQFMSAYGTFLVMESEKIINRANTVAAASIDAYDCRIEPFNNLVHQIRPHQGQIDTAAFILGNLQGSEIAGQEKSQVQDPYSFRCIPQVHGASADTLGYVKRVITTEINSVTDNPNVFPDEDEIISAGNFHGQPLALVLDFLKLALAELGSISERRTYLLLSGNRGLPVYLSRKPGLNSGMMIPQYTAASIVSKNKQLCTPASSDSIPSSNGQEDHVSMGANAAVQCTEIMDNVKSIIAIEWMTAAQALSLRKPLKSSPRIDHLLASYRLLVPTLEEDRELFKDMQKTQLFLSQQLL